MGLDVESPYFGNLSFSGTDMVACVNMTATSSEGKSKIYNITLGSLQTMSYSIHMDRHPIRTLGNINAEDYVMGPRTIAGSLVFAVFNKHWVNDILTLMRNDNLADNVMSILSDELPPFDIIISLANEYGVKARLVVYGVRLINEGQVMSVNDIYTENTYQYYANDIGYLTDESSESSGAASNNKTINITNYSSSVTNSLLCASKLKNAITNNNSNIVNNESIILSADTYSPRNIGLKGVAKLYLNPRQSSGTITISGTQLNSIISINVLQFLASDGLNGDIPIELYPGQYTAIYSNSKTSSNTLILLVSDYSKKVNKMTEAPTILNRTESSITLSTNKNTHTAIMYCLVDADESKMVFNKIKIDNSNCIIDNLKSNSIYRIYSTNENNDNSDTIDVTTLDTDLYYYTDLKQYIFTNQSKILSNSTINIYYTCIDFASNIASRYQYRISFQDAFIYLLQDLTSQKKAINKSDFSSETDYDNAILLINSKIDTCNHLIDLAQDKVNNEHYVLNYINANTKPVDQPKFKDKLNNILTISSAAETLNIYDFNDKLFKTIAVKTLEDNSSYTFLGRPGQKYYAFAIDALGEKSPKFEMRLYIDDDKIRNIVSNKQDQYNYETKYVSSDNEITDDFIKDSMDNNTYKDIVLLNAKNNDSKITFSPVIIYFDKTRIDINISSLDLLGDNGTSYFAVISKSEDIFSSKLFKKKEFSPGETVVSFTAIDDFIRDSESYIFWIEDYNGNQISKCATLNMQDSDTQSSIKSEFIMTNIKKDILNMLATKITVTQDILTCINAAFDDEDVNTDNIYDIIIKNVVLYDERYIDIYTTVQKLFECKIELNGAIYDNFFNSKIIIDTTQQLVITPYRDKKYTVTIYKVDSKGIVSYESIKVEKESTQDISIDKNYKFMSIVCIDSDPTIKSDIVFIDTFLCNYSSVDNKIEVI